MNERNPHESKITSFIFGDTPQPVVFAETLEVKRGVSCDVYKIPGDDSKDLAIVTVQQGCKTPLQKVLEGDETVEGFMSGEGTLNRLEQRRKTSRIYIQPRNWRWLAARVGIGEQQCGQVTSKIWYSTKSVRRHTRTADLRTLQIKTLRMVL